MQFNPIQHAHDRRFDYTTVKLFGRDGRYKVKITCMKSCLVSGLERPKQDTPSRCQNVNDSKLENNISRAKAKIFDLAFCNPWEYYVTGTLSPDKYDRTNLKKFIADLTLYIRNYNARHGLKIKYLFIPELHSDGKSWHVHGFLMGLPKEHLRQFKVGDTMGKSIADKVLAGDVVYEWSAYSKKFGFCDLEPIGNAEAVSKYITKYINKELGNCVKELGDHLYYHSRGLNFAPTIASGNTADIFHLIDDMPCSYQSDYCIVYWLSYDLCKDFLSNVLTALTDHTTIT